MGNLERWGSGPDHLTVPLIVPPLATDTTWYSLLWPAVSPAPLNSIPNEIANIAALNIRTNSGKSYCEEQPEASNEGNGSLTGLDL